MSNIWDNVTRSIYDALDVELLRLRETPEFRGMGSEIERAFAAHMILGSRVIPSLDVLLGMPTEASSAYFLAPQVQIGSYRVDFVFAKAKYFDRPSKWVVIECDGHDFHEKTKEQAARDKARDRFLSAEAGKVLRFTGSEIFRDVGACWEDVTKVVIKLDRG